MDEVSERLLEVIRERQGDCDHGVTFDADEARKLLDASKPPNNAAEWIAGNPASAEIRRRWPRLMGKCPKGCGFDGIAYASAEHYACGDW